MLQQVSKSSVSDNSSISNLSSPKPTDIHPELTLEQVQKGASGGKSKRVSVTESDQDDLEINTMFDLHSRLGIR